jgi:phage tail-like protein
MYESAIHFLVLRDQQRWDDEVAEWPTLFQRTDGALWLIAENSPVTPAANSSFGLQTQSGELQANAVDAGASELWERVWVDAETPVGTSVTIEFAVSGDKNTVPANLDWIKSPSLDVFLPAFIDNNSARFLWLKITLSSNNLTVSPALLQVQAATATPSYFDYLPRMYQRHDASRSLERWLALLRAEIGDWERDLNDLPRQLDARTVDETDVDLLSSWLALDLPARLSTEAKRHLLDDAPSLYRKRGTPIGIRLLAQRYLGMKIHILEAYRQRAIWQLGREGSQLGFDTGLAAGFPDGFIVPGFTYANRALSGLRGDYYEGMRFDILRHSRVDPNINFQWGTGSPDGIANFPSDNFTVRWSGQVRPRYNETYTFRTLSDDGVRLWVSGLLLIDNWTDHPPTTDAGQIKLEAGRWYPLILEYYENTWNAEITLNWSSASQRSEIIPQECLYPILDKSVDFAPEDSANCALIEVGNAVVGQSRPLTAEAFGEPLSDDYAHLFTVYVPASQVSTKAQRQALLDLIEAEKPAHSDYILCLVEPTMRVGIQSRLGIDSIVAGPPPPLMLDQSRLGLNSYVADPDPGKVKSRLGQIAHVGMNTIINKGVL